MWRVVTFDCCLMTLNVKEVDIKLWENPHQPSASATKWKDGLTSTLEILSRWPDCWCTCARLHQCARGRWTWWAVQVQGCPGYSRGTLVTVWSWAWTCWSGYPKDIKVWFTDKKDTVLLLPWIKKKRWKQKKTNENVKIYICQESPE